MSTSVDIEFKDFGYFDSDVTGFNDATGLPIFDRAQNSEFLANMLGALIGNGVYPNPSTNLQVIERDDAVFGVQVLPGKIWIDGRFAWPKEPILLEADPASTTADRIDIIVVERNNPDRKFSVKCITGTPAASPVPPTPERTTDVHQRVLCQYRVRRNATKVNQADITDTRYNSDLCGVVTGTITQIDTTTLYEQINAAIVDHQAYLEENKQFVKDFTASIQDEGYMKPDVEYIGYNTVNKTPIGSTNELVPDTAGHAIYVSASGNDETGDGSEENPYLTIRRAYESIPLNWYGNCTIYIGAGSYYETMDYQRDSAIAESMYWRLDRPLNLATLQFIGESAATASELTSRLWAKIFIDYNQPYIAFVNIYSRDTNNNAKTTEAMFWYQGTKGMHLSSCRIGGNSNARSVIGVRTYYGQGSGEITIRACTFVWCYAGINNWGFYINAWSTEFNSNNIGAYSQRGAVTVLATSTYTGNSTDYQKSNGGVLANEGTWI